MKRRNFLKYTAPLSIAPVMLQGRAISPFVTPKMMQAFTNCAEAEERCLVMVQLSGANDGLNTVVPMDAYADYAFLRPTIKIDQADLIPLDTTLPIQDQVGLNPGMQGFKDLYDQGKLNIIQGVAYDNNNKSHFKGTDLWLSGGDSTAANFNHTSGWMGRYMDSRYPGYVGNTALSPDPLGIQFGDTKPSFGFVPPISTTVSVNLSGQNPAGYYNLVQGVGGAPLSSYPSSDYGAEMEYVMNIQSNADAYSQQITDVFNNGANSVTYPDTNLADQLKTVARLLNGGSTTKIFLVKLGGFDTHNNQVDSSNTSVGKHTDLLTILSDAVKAFHDDLDALGLGNKVMTVTFSEFGRKAVENGNYGTDHGTLNPMFVIGNGVKGGVTGTNVDLQNLTNNGTQLGNQQHDYRQIYSTLLQDWLGANDTILTDTYMPTSLYPKLDLINANTIVDPTCYGAAPLPVELLFFSAKANDQRQVELMWETGGEYNNDYFVVQRSGDGETFNDVVRVERQGIDTESITTYEALDTKPLDGTSYYRLKQVDKDGTTTYSDLQPVFIDSNYVSKMKVYPNPAVFDINLVFNSEKNYEAVIRIIGKSGIIYKTQVVKVTKGFNKFNLPAERLTSGQYFVSLIASKYKIEETVSFIKQ